ncbi:MAG: threonine--tRNA ligase [Rhodospirillaceae bacterium]|jgi:threonyl-tRNA synthetase|nr:threonine--tRNA ligase [Rhodospirillaceae bacterium]MBT5564846.1 threonine--tRNA ligase [Rhodospirillaceae bacterium]MBT6089190.1 threonine--tRNA ligase [Rhodospirillaceae bacterium]MBT6961557.1 threonine--tRNA ligase [Rhodospirillaceae bacterium]
MVAITLPDGSVRSFPGSVTGAVLAADIGPGLAKAALAIRLNGEMTDLATEITEDASVSIVTGKDEDGLELLRHDAAHVMAEAVQDLFPDTQVTIGPVIENGFFYDFAREKPFSLDDFEKIERRMAEIVDRDEEIVREVWDREDAIRHFSEAGETYKAEIIQDLPVGEDISVYRQGSWLDLCRGPHLPSTGKLGKAFKLMKLAGAYWRGDHRNEMLQRIYGTCWATEKQLKAHLLMLEEAEKRDHRILGREMDLFHLQEEAQGSVFWHPKGYTIWLALESYIRHRLDGAGYVEVKTPQLLNSTFWEQSGHWSKFRENMFVVPDEIPSTDDDAPVLSNDSKLMAIKPMNCPAHVQIYKNDIRSYRDLPLRMAEFGCCHRNEPHGALHGLMRVRQMTQDDAHIFCEESQVTEETTAFCALLQSVYKDLGFDELEVKLATRPEVRAGEDATWDRAEAALEAAVQAANLDYETTPGEGAFYGPKLEFHLKDAIGRTWQCGTIQLDFVLPERLDASYIGRDGEKHRPVMLHRAILGSLERFIGILIENYAGKLPLWLAPVQVVVTTITSDADAYAAEVAEALKAKGLRVETDVRNEKINYKIREHSLAKVPVIAVVGQKEAEAQAVALRRLGGKTQEILALAEATDTLAREAAVPGS